MTGGGHKEEAVKPTRTQDGCEEAAGGIYALILRVEGEGVTLQVGALGKRRFRPGYYCYAGSALKGLRARVSRHFRTDGKRLRWHVDYLRDRTEAVGAVVWRTTRRAECALNRMLQQRAGGQVQGFGAGDCRCDSHLHYFARDPTPYLLRLTPAGERGTLWRPPPR